MASHRYWRLYITANNGDASYTSISELELRTAPGGADVTTPSTTATASSFYSTNSSTAAKAINNNTGSGSNSWVTSGVAGPHWLALDLASAMDLVEVAIWCEPALPTRAPKDFLIQYSDDNSSWTTLRTITGATTGWSSDVAKVFTLVDYAASGTVQDAAGAAVARSVRAYRRDTGALLGETISNATTGAYTVSCSNYSGEVQIVCLDDAAGTLELDLVARVIPNFVS